MFCAPSLLQRQLCRQMLCDIDRRKELEGGFGASVLSVIAKISKVVNHPDLLIKEAGPGDDEQLFDLETPSSVPGSMAAKSPEKDTDWAQYFPPGYQEGDVSHSGKLHFLFELLARLRESGNERIIIVSNYTSTLDLLESMCKQRDFPFVR